MNLTTLKYLPNPADQRQKSILFDSIGKRSLAGTSTILKVKDNLKRLFDNSNDWLVNYQKHNQLEWKFKILVKIQNEIFLLFK